jgi:hypothetical protein
MNKFVIVLIIIGIYILSRKHILYEGISNQDNDNNNNNEEKKPDDNEEKFTKDDCPYRKKTNLGKMCNEKWGQPDCNLWEKTENVKDLEKTKTNVLKGYYSNDFMYEIDYEEYPTILIDDSNIKEIDENTPRGIHSSFFS